MYLPNYLVIAAVLVIAVLVALLAWTYVRAYSTRLNLVLLTDLFSQVVDNHTALCEQQTALELETAAYFAYTVELQEIIDDPDLFAQASSNAEKLVVDSIEHGTIHTIHLCEDCDSLQRFAAKARQKVGLR